jgi:hypothetical protein
MSPAYIWGKDCRASGVLQQIKIIQSMVDQRLIGPHEYITDDSLAVRYSCLEESTPMLYLVLKHCCRLESGKFEPRQEHESGTCKAKHTRKDLSPMHAIWHCKDSPADRPRCKACDRCEQKHQARTSTNLREWGNLHNQYRDQGDVSPRKETKYGSKGNVGGIVGSGDPESQDNDTGNVTDGNEGVVSAKLICNDAR